MLQLVCLSCKTTCLTTWEHCCHKETVSIKEVISSKLFTYRNGQTKASEVFNFLFGLLKSSPLQINMSVVIQETNIRKCTEKQKKSGSVGHGDGKGKARNGRVLPTCCFAPSPTSAPAKWGTTGGISSRPSAPLLCYPVPLQMPPCLLREGASLVSWEAAGEDTPCGLLVTPSSGWGWQQLYKTPDESGLTLCCPLVTTSFLDSKIFEECMPILLAICHLLRNLEKMSRVIPSWIPCQKTPDEETVNYLTVGS